MRPSSSIPLSALSNPDRRGRSSRVRAVERTMDEQVENCDERGMVAPTERLHDGPTGPAGTNWYWIIALSTIAILICYADRTNISVAIVPMSKEMDWSETYKGTVLSVFFIGYAATQVRYD